MNDSLRTTWVWDLTDKTIKVSEDTKKMLGYAHEEDILDKSFINEHISRMERARIYQLGEEFLCGYTEQLCVTFPFVNKQGIKYWYTAVGQFEKTESGRPKHIKGVLKDVTDKFSRLNRLPEYDHCQQLGEKLSNTGHWRIDMLDHTLFWSSGVYSIHGLTPEEYSPSVVSAVEFYVQEERGRIEQYLEQAIQNKKGFYFKSTIVNKRNKRVKVECLGDVELNENGEVISIYGAIRDITHVEETFEKLKLLAMVNYTIRVPIFFIDEKDNIVYQDLSPQFGNQSSVLFNYINFSISDYLKFKTLAKEKGQIKKSNISFDNFITVFDISVTFEADESVYIWIVEDVTEKFKKEQQQIISNRLALLGNTFGNVSHDINNVLGVALGAIEMLELKFSQGEQDISNYIDRVKNAIDKGKSVTERLLAFTRKPPVEVVVFDPIQEIKENKYLFKQLLLSTIDFSINVDNVNCQIKFPQGEFINILLNIVLNAQDAIREAGLVGKIEISANITKDDWLEVHVLDSGIGIEQENLSKIFDPFYSSKSVNKGNGIGLANVYDTIYKHNGEIRVEGKGAFGGAHFTLLFKCQSVHHLATKSEPSGHRMEIRGKNVLVLDDEQSIAEFVSLYLESEGANAVYVTNKTELLAQLEKGNVFDIFITDMILPDISGREAVETVLSHFPKISVYSMSGYIGEDDHKWHYPVLRKPFNSNELAEFLS